MFNNKPPRRECANFKTHKIRYKQLLKTTIDDEIQLTNKDKHRRRKQ